MARRMVVMYTGSWSCSHVSITTTEYASLTWSISRCLFPSHCIVDSSSSCSQTRAAYFTNVTVAGKTQLTPCPWHAHETQICFKRTCSVWYTHLVRFLACISFPSVPSTSSGLFQQMQHLTNACLMAGRFCRDRWISLRMVSMELATDTVHMSCHVLTASL